MQNTFAGVLKYIPFGKMGLFHFYITIIVICLDIEVSRYILVYPDTGVIGHYSKRVCLLQCITACFCTIYPSLCINALILNHCLAFQSTSIIILVIKFEQLYLRSSIWLPYLPLKEETAAEHLSPACLDFLWDDFSEILKP